MSNQVQVKDVIKNFDQVRAVDGVSLEIEQGQFFSLLGPSGCGKTTLLRLIAGSEVPNSGATESVEMLQLGRSDAINGRSTSLTLTRSKHAITTVKNTRSLVIRSMFFPVPTRGGVMTPQPTARCSANH